MPAMREDDKTPSKQFPFPNNRQFISEPVLSEKMRKDIYEQVVTQRKSIRDVSLNNNVSMERVAAIVRMQRIEEDWKKEVSLHTV